MIKYYRVEGFDYQYGHIHGRIEEYYLLKEGWICCREYRENPNDSYYILDSNGTPGARKDYCVAKEKCKDDEMFESLEEAKKYFVEELNKFYKDEALKLLQAHQKLIEDIVK